MAEFVPFAIVFPHQALITHKGWLEPNVPADFQQTWGPFFSV